MTTRVCIHPYRVTHYAETPHAHGYTVARTVLEFMGERFVGAFDLQSEILDDALAMAALRERWAAMLLPMLLVEFWDKHKGRVLAEYRRVGFPQGQSAPALKRWWFGESIYD